MFTMDTNGTLRTAMSFDYELYQSLNIRVQAMDGNSSSVEGAFTVIVANENEAPNALDHLSGLSVLENQLSGTIVGTFQAQDPDGNDLIYHLVSGWEMKITACLPWIRMVLCELRCLLIMNCIRV